MYRFWDAIIEPIVHLAKPKVIVEVGSELGRNTRKALNYCRDNGAVCHVIDPAPKYDVAAWKAEFDGCVQFHEVLSLEALPRISHVDVALIDGDHNWYTVFNELRALDQQVSAGGAFPITLFHDVGWPYGRRDLYYDPATIPEADRQPYRALGMLPGQSALCEQGGMNVHLPNSDHEGGPRNGVLTAVEDFMAQSERTFRYVQLDAMHGLGVLVSQEREALHPGLAALIDQLVPSEYLARLMAAAERDRIDLTITVQQLSGVGARLAELEANIVSLQDTIATMRDSWSWRLTRPFRAVRQIPQLISGRVSR